MRRHMATGVRNTGEMVNTGAAIRMITGGFSAYCQDKPSTVFGQKALLLNVATLKKMGRIIGVEW